MVWGLVVVSEYVQSRLARLGASEEEVERAPPLLGLMLVLFR